MEMTVEKISAITFRVTNMRSSVRFYGDVLGMEIIYGGEDGCFSSLRTKDVKDPILNLEQGTPVAHWGRMIFYVADVDAFSTIHSYKRKPKCLLLGFVRLCSHS